MDPIKGLQAVFEVKSREIRRRAPPRKETPIFAKKFSHGLERLRNSDFRLAYDFGKILR
jgi:hypothetical protein